MTNAKQDLAGGPRPKPGPIALVNADKPDEVIAYACGKCGWVVAGIGKGPGMFAMERDAISFAVRHCGPWTCEKCGVEHDRAHQPTCRECFNKAWAKKRADKEKERFEKAEKVTEYDGPVFCEAAGTGGEFFSTVQDLIDHCECEDVDVPSCAWTCIKKHPQIDIESMCEQALDEHHEGCELDDVEELEAFIKQWNAKQTGESWEVDYSKAVMIGEEK
jgi:hypothetical protein